MSLFLLLYCPSLSFSFFFLLYSAPSSGIYQRFALNKYLLFFLSFFIFRGCDQKNIASTNGGPLRVSVRYSIFPESEGDSLRSRREVKWRPIDLGRTQVASCGNSEVRRLANQKAILPNAVNATQNKKKKQKMTCVCTEISTTHSQLGLNQTKKSECVAERM